MDGTLTVGIHDFEAIRGELGLPPGRPILETIAALPADQADILRRRLNDIEIALAHQAQPQPGARELLLELQARNVQVGILTRNTRQNAFQTLQASNLIQFFDPEYVLGRESAAPKPSPDGINKLLAAWNISASAAVMVGDYLFDIEAGQNAGTATVLLNTNGNHQWAAKANISVPNLKQLRLLVTG